MPRTSPGVPMKWLHAHIGYEGDACLIWPFARRSDGYANLKDGSASRVMCLLAHGEPTTPIHEAAHSCGNGPLGCVHPKHLRWATPIENASDKARHGTQARGEKHGASKLSSDQVIEIRRRHSGGESQSSLGREFGLCVQSVHDIVHFINWKHLVA